MSGGARSGKGGRRSGNGSYREAVDSPNISRLSAGASLWFVPGVTDWGIVARTWFDARRIARVLCQDEEVVVEAYPPREVPREVRRLPVSASPDRPAPTASPSPSLELVPVIPAAEVLEHSPDTDRPRALRKRAPCSAGHDGDLWCDYCLPFPHPFRNVPESEHDSERGPDPDPDSDLDPDPEPHTRHGASP